MSDTDLGRRSTYQYDDHWLIVGWVSLSSRVSNYESKYNYGYSPVSAQNLPTNTLSICRSGSAACNVSGTPKCAASDDGATWYGRTQGATGRPKTFCVRYRKSTNYKTLAGTSRWRWTDVDERTWYWCPGGCCEMYF